MISIRNVTKSFGTAKAVDDLSLEIGQGELCVLLGPSGCGKSTTLRLVNRLLEPDSGSVLVGGENTSFLPPHELRRRIGYVIQSIGLFPHLSVHDNIATVPRLLGWPRARIGERVAELLALVGLPDYFAKRWPRQLSGGEAQRVGVARALAADPPVLLMDEPFGALDPLTRVRLQVEFAALQKRLGTTVLFVTHDVGEALRLGGTMVLMRGGQIEQLGRPEDFAHQPASAFVSEFLGPEYGLELLGRYPVMERLRPLSALSSRGAVDSASAAQSGELSLPRIASTANLKEALSAMVAGGNLVALVCDDSGAVLGEISFEDAACLDKEGEQRCV
ncbi:MAG: ABC transporter ATP-binding protein [Spirochaetes bacterium]|nr:ABC transporter ATP-binding protein [Spirochaetota bacterium]MBU0954770.1 ABC transporter ATP-binding protein [Spirochaetota bacterium]